MSVPHAPKPVASNLVKVWPTVPNRFLLMIEQYRGHYVLRGERVSRSETFESIGDRLRSIGVGAVQCGVYVVPKDRNERVRITIGETFDDWNLEE